VFRLIAVLLVAGGLAFFLAREVVLGLRSGRIRYADSHRVCVRSESPVVFWLLVVVFSAFSAGALYACLQVLRETLA
jgi:hypothetical protein